MPGEERGQKYYDADARGHSLHDAGILRWDETTSVHFAPGGTAYGTSAFENVVV